MHVTLRPAELAELLRGPNGPVVRKLFVDAEKVKVEAVRLAPKASGNLSHHIVKRFVVVNGRPTFYVGIENVPYARFVTEGAQPHEIHARNATNLVFFWPKVGHVVTMKSVNHPGNKPNRFLIKALAVLNFHGTNL